ncbi:MAG: hypothetical protein EB127_07365 [Alphaproteobacteria bacterium]|nr:hypothetical protein [Alphaproteobacteria bacterium]
MASEIAKSVISRQPQTINTLQYNQFRFVLHRTPQNIYFCQGVKFPGMSMETLKQPSPLATPIQRTPNIVNYENLEFSFLVAEDFKNWLEIHNWMHRLLPIRQFDNQYKENYDFNHSKEVRYQDASLILMNSVSKPFFAVHFRNCFPITLSNIELTTTVNDIIPVMCSASFAYTGYYLEKLT